LAPEGILIREELAVRPADAIPLVVGAVEVYLHSVGKVDRQAESLRLKKELSDAEAQIDRLRKLLESEFATRAPAPVVDKERAKLAELVQARARLAEQIQGL
jgi:valyl-tRNA synthetase